MKKIHNYGTSRFGLKIEHDHHRRPHGASTAMQKLTRPGIEPGSTAWEAVILPLDQRVLSQKLLTMDW
jgi:hypothetical protein